jgi:hypothetical protein
VLILGSLEAPLPAWPSAATDISSSATAAVAIVGVTSPVAMIDRANPSAAGSRNRRWNDRRSLFGMLGSPTAIVLPT